MRQRERENMHAALVKSGWRIHGEGGAAELLGLKPTTLISRMKKMGLKRADPAEPDFEFGFAFEPGAAALFRYQSSLRTI